MTITLTLPKEAELKVKAGDKIEIGDALYSVYSSELVTIDIATKLHIQPDSIFHHLNKIIGEEIKKDDILAQRKGKLFSHKVVSEYQGTLKEIDHHKGTIILNTFNESQQEFSASFQGTVDSIENNHLKVSVKNGTEIPLKDVTMDGSGDLYLFHDEALFFSATEEEIDKSVIVIEEIKTHIQAKCEALGCNGFLYLKGDITSDLPTARFKTEEDYNKIISSKKKHIIFSMEDKKAIVYD